MRHIEGFSKVMILAWILRIGVLWFWPSSLSLAQEAPAVTWQKTIGKKNGMGQAVRQTADGGFIVCGYAEIGDRDTDIYLIKTDKNGNVEWEETFGDIKTKKIFMGEEKSWPYIENCRSLEVTKDGGFILAGERWVFGAGDLELLILRVDETGKLIWKRAFNFGTWIQRGVERTAEGIRDVAFEHSTGDQANSVKQTSDGGFVVCGESRSAIKNMYLLKVDRNGRLEWQRTFGAGNEALCYSVQEAKDGGFLAVGSIMLSSTVGRDVYMVRTDKTGKVIWQKNLGGKGNREGQSVEPTRDGAYVIVGSTRPATGTQQFEQILLTKIDTDGNQLWERILLKGTESIGYSVQETEDGGFVVTGGKNHGPHGKAFRYSDIYLVKTDKLGKEEWTMKFGGEFDDVGYSVRKVMPGGYIITGFTKRRQTTPQIVLIRTDETARVKEAN